MPSTARIGVAMFAGALALACALAGLRGVDFAAAAYRVELFHRDGLTLWDSQWYGGHWTFGYSVIFGPVAALIGVSGTEIVCAAAASWAFDRLAVARFGAAGRAGAIAFAAGTLVQVVIGQAPYLLGETIGLLALVAATSRRWTVAVTLAMATALASPLAALFLGIAALAWALGRWPERHLGAWALAGAALVPVLALELLFPGQGVFPFATKNLVEMSIAIVLVGLVALRHDRVMAIGVGLYAVAVVGAFVVPSAVGNNVTRLGICFGVALAICLTENARFGRVLLAAAVVPLSFAQWLPADAALHGQDTDASSSAAYYQPLVGYLRRVHSPSGRIEAVPTRLHWDTVYLARHFPLARGWERQLDTADNPIFYDGSLTPASYRAWLLDSGVRFVALPDVQLDWAALAEARLIQAGVPGIRPVWSSAHWRVFAVDGSPGLLNGPGRVVNSRGDRVVLDAQRPGRFLLRVRFDPAWRVTVGHATVARSHNGWIALRASQAGRIVLRVESPL